MPNEPVILMILPACLVFVGMVTGFVLWSWARGVDASTVEELHDELRKISSRMKSGSNPNELLDLRHENEELHSQSSQLMDLQQVDQSEIAVLKSQLKMHESESILAEQTIRDLRSELQMLQSLTQAIELVDEISDDAASETDDLPVSYSFKQPVFSIASGSSNTESGADFDGPNILRPSFGEASQAIPTLDIEYGGVVGQDDDLGLVYTRPPMIHDNLQLISGIAAKLENQLNDFGIFTFQQIMLWNQHNVEHFSNLLDTFHGRVERDDWVGQATALYNKSQKLRRAG